MFPTRRITTSGGDKFRDEFSLAFDGTNDYIELSGTFNYNVHSISIWLKETATSAQSTVFDHRDGNNDGINLYLTSGQPIYAVNNADAHYTTTIGLNQWTHIVLTNDGSISTIYVNGVSVETADTSGETINILSSANARFARDNTGNYFTGSLSEAAIYDKALSSSEVKTLYNGREPYNHKEGICSSNLKAWWRMGDGVLDDRNGLVADQTNATLGSNLVTNPTCDANLSSSSTGPELGWSHAGSGNSTMSGGKMNIKGTGGSSIRADGILTVGTTYKITCDVTVNAGTAKIESNGGGTGVTIDTSGSQTFYYTTDTANLRFNRISSDCDIDIDNVFVREVNGNAGVMTNMDTDDFEGDTP